MALVTLQSIGVSFGGPALLDNANLTLDKGERVCVVGRNGEGKSTLLRVINGEIAVDSGERVVAAGVKLAMLDQAVPDALDTSVAELLDTRLEAERELDSWEREQRIGKLISKLNLDASANVSRLSGGLKRRVLLAAALAVEPDVLLLDEPTNHLDIEGIEWLEKFLRNWRGTLVFITHDRAFLRTLATRIVEIDRGRLSSWPGDYDAFVRNKHAALETEAKEQAEFDKKLAREEVWIRQGIKARRTRNEGRVRALKKMRTERAQRRERLGTATITAQQAEKSGKTVVEAVGVSYEIGGKTICRDFSTTIARGDKIGILGPNGAGKTTLINLLLGRLQPQSGEVTLGTNISLAYFDQMRETLNPDQTAQDNVGGGSEIIDVNGQQKHIIGYLQDFLFSPARARSPIRALSGGERNRLLLAKLFTQAANFLVMDEPTNDLDVETLELLEEQLLNFNGTLLLVSHDRAFIDNIVTSTLVLPGDGNTYEYVGGYDDYVRQHKVVETAKIKPHKAAVAKQPDSKSPKLKKLGYMDQRELDAMPDTIDTLETEKSELETRMSDPDFYQQDAEIAAQTQERYAKLTGELEALYARWDELESKIS
ncbi:MAG: ATP-binding cassette domain-containing protein [Pseudomonadota bacterium]